MTDENESPRPRNNVRPYIPIAILALGLLGGMAWQTVRAVEDGKSLAALKTQQEAPFQQALKVRQEIDAIAGETAALAAQGDPAARAIVEDLRRQGITLPAPRQP